MKNRIAFKIYGVWPVLGVQIVGTARRNVSTKNSEGVRVAKEGTVLPPLSPSLFLSFTAWHFVLLSTN